MIEEVLQKIGFNDKEIQVYMACLQLGPASVRKVADKARINRGTTYDILRSLRGQGLVIYYHQDKHQYFIAEDPAKLKVSLEQKFQKLKEIESEIEEIIPQLKSIYNKAGTKPVVKYYSGLKGVKIILQDVIETCQINSKEYYVFSSSTIKNYLYGAYPDFSDDRIGAKIKVKVISIGPGGEMRGLDERRWLTKKESTPTYTLIYDNKVAMISVDAENKPLGVIIEDKNIYQTQKMIFEFIWDKL